MLLTEYDEELHIKNEKDISYSEGRRQGVQLVNELYAWLAKCGRSEDITKAISNPGYFEKMLTEYQGNSCDDNLR
ncbi:hypothetical protein SAMN04487770_11212 [Butyrivibrio sp. ob235]|uniref:hypothetical protein n=1 Tax=Butyrivibrio sp. ob235 TaxID=1761780 RepID=UPI0008D0B076|nr:hypothetical protein [Butyrivibrio sp. ob235]SEL53695.1 hypothetical protein SAMN04487770_11212 [Butyrivibrio sp. ob235]